MKKNYDAIIIGCGSVGTPIAKELAENKLKVLVIDKNSSPGQGQNKAAIGGIRATFSDPGKIEICRQSLRIVSNWKEKYGEDIGWVKGGYLFPAYTQEIEKSLKELLKIQKKHGLNINWIDAKKVKELVPGIDSKNLRGSTYSPDDGNMSPLLVLNAYYNRARKKRTIFLFNETVTAIKTQKSKIVSVITDKGEYFSSVVINAAGAFAREIGNMLNLDIKVFPDCHEAGITEPVERFFKPMIVDLRKENSSSNFYFYQNYWNKIIFCMTPDPPILGYDKRSTSDYLIRVSRRLIKLLPHLKNIRVRRTWRGLYPMTPDGIPIIDKVKEYEGLYLAVGLCGQGLMLGPGLAKNIASLIINKKPIIKEEDFREFSFYRSYKETTEKLK